MGLPFNDFLFIRYFIKDGSGYGQYGTETTLTNFAIQQIKKLHPHSVVHIYTNNDQFRPDGCVVHYNPNMIQNHLCQLDIYGLIDVPFMYLDTDILINRPFEDGHCLSVDGSPFNMYRFQGAFDFDAIAGHATGLPESFRYNAGMVYVSKPGKHIIQEMWECQHEHFNMTPDELIQSGLIQPTTELVVSYYIAKNKLKMGLIEDVNVFMWDAAGSYEKYHSVHFAGETKRTLAHIVRRSMFNRANVKIA